MQMCDIWLPHSVQCALLLLAQYSWEFQGRFFEARVLRKGGLVGTSLALNLHRHIREWRGLEIKGD